METNDIMQHIDELLQGYSNEECAEILKEVISECQSRLKIVMKVFTLIHNNLERN